MLALNRAKNASIHQPDITGITTDGQVVDVFPVSGLMDLFANLMTLRTNAPSVLNHDRQGIASLLLVLFGMHDVEERQL